MNERTGMFCLSVLWRVFRGNFWMKISFRSRTKLKNLATFAIPFDAKQDLILCIGTLPARALWIKIGRTTGIDIFRAIKESPARCFPVPEVWHFIFLILPGLILNQSLKKAIKKIEPWPRRTSEVEKEIEESLWGVGNFLNQKLWQTPLMVLHCHCERFRLSGRAWQSHSLNYEIVSSFHSSQWRFI